MAFGVEAISPAPEGEPNFKAHIACAERGITHMECLWNLDALLGKGRFRFIVTPALDYKVSGDAKGDQTAIMTAVNQQVEAWVRAHPEQWLWMHRRWG